MNELEWHKSWIEAVRGFGYCKRGWDKNLKAYTESEENYLSRRSVWLQKFLKSQHYDQHCKRMGVKNRYR